GLESTNGHIQGGLHALFAQSVHYISTHAGLYGRPDHIGVGMVHEHRNRPPDTARYLEHLFEHVTIGVFQVNEDDIRIDIHYAPQEILHVTNHGDIRVASLPQALLEYRGSRDILIHHKNTKRWVGHLGAAL